jgi:hypothetical protein
MDSWLEQRIKVIKMCLRQDFVEPALALFYSGVDTMAFWAAPGEQDEVQKSGFIDWCDKYVVPTLGPAAAEAVNGNDLYGARCGILHTSSSTSRMSRTGEAREINYRFAGRVAVNLRATTSRPFVWVDIEALCHGFEVGGKHFLADLQGDPSRLAIAKDRAMRLFTWGVLAS